MKYFLLVLTAATVVACHFSFGFKTDVSLRNEYAHVQRTENLSFFYNVRKEGNFTVVDMTVKNTSNMYMSNLAMYINTKNAENYLYIGNLKHLSTEKVEFTIPDDVNQIKMNYRYYLSPEDDFLDPTGELSEEYMREDSVILFLK